MGRCGGSGDGVVIQCADDGLLRTTPIRAPLTIGDRVMLRIDDGGGYHTLIRREPGADIWRCDHP